MEDVSTILTTTLLNTKRASIFLDVTPQTLLRWVHEGKVPAVRIGERKYLYSRKSLEALIESGKINN
jgi:excisionase family DNA binding protein